MTLVLNRVGAALGGVPVLHDVSAEWAPGQFVALVGPNGAGKTTLLRAIAGLLPCTGAVTWSNEAVATMPPRLRARRFAYLPQGHAAHWPLPVRDIVALGRIPHGHPDPARLPDADRAMVAHAMVQTGVSALADRAVTTLSGGERARVALARVLAVQAPVILADEPTASLDPQYQLAIMALLADAARAGALVVAVTHDLGLAARHADAVLVLDQGRMAAAGPPAEALDDAVLRRVFGVSAYRAERDGRPVLVPWA